MRLVALVLMGSLLCGYASAQAKDGPISRPGFPSQLTGQPSKASKPSAKKSPGMLTKLTAAPKRLLTSTKNMLTPKKKTPAKKKATVTTVRRGPKPEQPGFLRQLFDREPPPPPRTVEEWMALEPIRP